MCFTGNYARSIINGKIDVARIFNRGALFRVSVSRKGCLSLKPYSGTGRCCKVNIYGSLHIPAKCRKKVGLEGKVVLAGHDDHVEIWEKDKWANEFQEARKELIEFLRKR